MVIWALGLIVLSLFIYSRAMLVNYTYTLIKSNKKKVAYRKFKSYCTDECRRYIIIIASLCTILQHKLNNPNSAIIFIENLYISNIAYGILLIAFIISIFMMIKSIWEVIGIVSEQFKGRGTTVHRQSRGIGDNTESEYHYTEEVRGFNKQFNG